MKIAIKIKNDRALVIWAGNNYPFVVCVLDHFGSKPGDEIAHWYHGTYFLTIEEALECFNERGRQYE